MQAQLSLGSNPRAAVIAAQKQVVQERKVQATAPTPAVPTPPPEQSLAEAVRSLGLNLGHAQDWHAHLDAIRKSSGEAAAMKEAHSAAFSGGSRGVLYSTEPDTCPACRSETTECIPCPAAHKFCTSCRQANFINHLEQCPSCRVEFRPTEPRYDRTFQFQVNPLLKQLATLNYKRADLQPVLASAEQKVKNGDEEDLSHVEKLLLQAKDIQTTHKKTGISGLSDTQVSDGVRDMSLAQNGNFRGLCYCSEGRTEIGPGVGQCSDLIQRTTGVLPQRYSFTQHCEVCNMGDERNAQIKAQEAIKRMETATGAYEHERLGSANGPADAQQRRVQRVQMHMRMQQQTWERKRTEHTQFKNVVTYVQDADSEIVR